MRQGFSLGKMVGQALEANLRYVTLATRVANSVAGAAFTASSEGAERVVAAVGKSVRQKQSGSSPQPQGARSAILLEGPTGSKPTAFFLIENHLAHEVMARVEITPLATRSGRKLRSKLQFDKREIALAAGQQVVARIGAPITTKLVLGEQYTGEIRVQGIPGASVPVVLRRIADPQAVPRSRRLTAGAPAGSAKKKAKPSRRRSRKAAKTASRA
jgi:hypothetical protein